LDDERVKLAVLSGAKMAEAHEILDGSPEA
jgi:hypothetical protein